MCLKIIHFAEIRKIVTHPGQKTIEFTAATVIVS